MKSMGMHSCSLQYGWPIPNVASKCSCGTNFSVDHAMICHKGGIPTLRHNEICDLTAELLADTSSGVSTEPRLQPIHNEVLQLRSANRVGKARLDVRASDFWCKGQDSFLTLEFFTQLPPPTAKKTLPLYTAGMKGRRKGIRPVGARSGVWSIHPLGFCIHWRHGQGVYHCFHENCRHLIWQEKDAILSRHPLDQMPNFLRPNPIGNQDH